MQAAAATAIAAYVAFALVIRLIEGRRRTPARAV